jgi:hypothetical protein
MWFCVQVPLPTLHFSQPTSVQIGPDLHFILFNNYDFHANRYSRRDTVLKNVNGILPGFSTPFIRFGNNSKHKRCKQQIINCLLSFTKIGARTTVLLLPTQTRLHSSAHRRTLWHFESQCAVAKSHTIFDFAYLLIHFPNLTYFRFQGLFACPVTFTRNAGLKNPIPPATALGQISYL